MPRPVSVMVIVPALSSVVTRDGRRGFGLINRLAGRLVETQLLARVRRVGNQLAHENFFVRVKRMDDDVQQLLNLRLKMMCLGFVHNRTNFITNARAGVKKRKLILNVVF